MDRVVLRKVPFTNRFVYRGIQMLTLQIFKLWWELHTKSSNDWMNIFVLKLELTTHI